MQFEPNEQQTQLGDSVRRVLADLHDFTQRRAIVAGDADRGHAVYRQLAELGVTGLLVAEADGGFGGRMEDLHPVLQACGESLVVAPIVTTAVLSATALGMASDETVRRDRLPGLVSGETVIAWAGPLEGRGLLTVRASRAGGSEWRLDGTCKAVPNAAQASSWLVPALTEAGDVVVFDVRRDADGVTRRDHRLIDDTPASDLRLTGVPARPLADPNDPAAGRAILARVEAVGMAALCVDMVGAAVAAYELSRAYLPVRQQFGKAIGENQALRHRLADMLVSLELARSMAMAAVVAADRPDEPGALQDIRRAKLVVGRHARSVCEQAIQCHGGIGMTEEHPVGHSLRRVLVRELWFGDWHAQARKLLAAAGPEAAPTPSRSPSLH